MSTIQQKIEQAAPHNRELLGTLAQTDYAKPALRQQNAYIADLEKEVQDLDKQLKQLEERRKAELKDHEKYRDSVMKRFAYKVGRKEEKFNVKAEKEEKEYFEALQEEHKARALRSNTSQTLDQARTLKKDLETAAARNTEAQKALDELYDTIFEGPTPDFPAEDSKENEANEALRQYQLLRSRGEAEYQGLNILTAAKGKMSHVKMYLEEARSHSRMDMFGGGMMSDMMERSALSKAGVALSQVNQLLGQAQRLSPELRSLPPVQIAQGNLMSDVMFDNVFTDMQFHEKIKNSQLQVERASQDLNQQIDAAATRYKQTTNDLNQRIKDLEHARIGLQQVRQDVFSRTAG